MPPNALGEPTTQYGADHAGQAEHGPYHTHVFPAVPDGNNVRNNGLRQNHEPAAAQALHHAGKNKPSHISGEPTNHRPDEKHDKRPQEERLPPHHVA